MKSYYSLVEFESAKPLFLGKIPLVTTEEGVARNGHTEQKPIATDGTVPKVWHSDDEPAARLPEKVDTTDPFQVAPMASFYQRPHGTLGDVIDGNPETVHVFSRNTEIETDISDIDAAEYEETVVGSISDGDIQEINRRYEWDESAIESDSRSLTSGFSAATYVVGFVDGQDMHDPYTHLGVSAADAAPQALHDVLSALDGTPLWSPVAYPVIDHQSFPVTDVLRIAN